MPMIFDRASRTLGRFFPLHSLSMVVVILVGCGGEDGPQVFDLAGKVTYGGQPVPSGYIEFAPDVTLGNHGPGTSADIHDGRYTTLPGRGTIGGPHVVTLRGFDGVQPPIPEDLKGYPISHSSGNAMFTVEVKLKIPEEKSEHDFDIPKQ